MPKIQLYHFPFSIYHTDYGIAYSVDTVYIYQRQRATRTHERSRSAPSPVSLGAHGARLPWLVSVACTDEHSGVASMSLSMGTGLADDDLVSELALALPLVGNGSSAAGNCTRSNLSAPVLSGARANPPPVDWGNPKAAYEGFEQLNERSEGFFTAWWNRTRGKLLLEVPEAALGTAEFVVSAMATRGERDGGARDDTPPLAARRVPDGDAAGAPAARSGRKLSQKSKPFWETREARK